MNDLVEKVARITDDQPGDWRKSRAAIAAVYDDLAREDNDLAVWVAMRDAASAAFLDPENQHGDVFGEVFRAMLAANRREVLGDDVL